MPTTTRTPRRRPILYAVVLLVVFLVGALVGYRARGDVPDARQADRFAGTRRMAARWQQITTVTDPRLNLFMNAARARTLDETVRQRQGSVPPALLMERAKELLNAGQTDDVIARLAARAREPGAKARRSLRGPAP